MSDREDQYPMKDSDPPSNGMVVDPDLLREAWNRNYETQKLAIEEMRAARRDNRHTRLLALGTTLVNVAIAAVVILYVADVRRISMEAGEKIDKVGDTLTLVAESVVVNNEAEIAEAEADVANRNTGSANVGMTAHNEPDAAREVLISMPAAAPKPTRRAALRKRLSAQKKAIEVIERLAVGEEEKKQAAARKAQVEEKAEALDVHLE